jgi:hypothetical protein
MMDKGKRLKVIVNGKIANYFKLFQIAVRKAFVTLSITICRSLRWQHDRLRAASKINSFEEA